MTNTLADQIIAGKLVAESLNQGAPRGHSETSVIKFVSTRKEKCRLLVRNLHLSLIVRASGRAQSLLLLFFDRTGYLASSTARSRTANR